MEDLYKFLKRKLKENNMKIGTFIEQTNMSKSTIYRVMKGYQKPSYELLDMMYKILNLSEEEKRKLNYYISAVDMDEGSIKASLNVKKLLFDKRIKKAEDMDFIYYKDNEKYLKNLHEIISNIDNTINNKDAIVNVHIVNSSDINIMNNVYKYSEKIHKRVKNVNIEHLISFSKYDAENSVDTVYNFLPLLEFPFYNLLYTESLSNSKNELFGNYMMITASYTEDDDDKFIYYIFSFMMDSINTCYSGSSKDCIYDLFTRNFNYIKENFKPSIRSNTQLQDFEFLMMDIDSLESDDSSSEIFLFKKTPCYKRIPGSVYTRLADEVIKSGNISKFVKLVNKVDFVGEQEACTMLKSIANGMGERYERAKNTYTVDILSKNGLLEFVDTGYLSDHFDGMPKFSPEDIVVILKDMKRRHIDPNEKYNLYIIGDTEESNFILTIFKDKGFLIENVNESGPSSNLSYCMIENNSMCNILYEFAKEYVPSRLAMIDNDAIEFLDHLIEIAEKKINN